MSILDEVAKSCGRTKEALLAGEARVGGRCAVVRVIAVEWAGCRCLRPWRAKVALWAEHWSVPSFLAVKASLA